MNRLQLLIIDDNVAPLTLSVIRCLGITEKFDIHILNLNNLRFPSFRFSKYVKSYTGRKEDHDEKVIFLIMEMCRKVKADIIIPVKERTVRIVAENLPLFLGIAKVPPMPEPDTLDLVRNKWLLYNWLYDKNQMNDRPLRYSDVVQSGKVIRPLDFPVLVKPFWGSGGRGIKFVKNNQELMDFHPLPEYDSQEWLIQNYIRGYDIDISALVEKGKILTYNIQKDISGVEKLAYSRSIEFLRNDRLLAVASEIFRDLQYNGIAHLDFRYDEQSDSFVLIDFNARFWSSLLGSLNSGINFPWLYCRKALQEDFVAPGYETTRYYVNKNLFKIAKKRIPVSQTELKYTFRDPLPFLVEMVESVLFRIKKILNPHGSNRSH